MKKMPILTLMSFANGNSSYTADLMEGVVDLDKHLNLNLNQVEH